jgi:C_GCAxxG_C_C family probable redox protein
MRRAREEVARMTDSCIKRSPEEFRKEAEERACRYERDFHGCSQAVVAALQELLEMEDELLFKAAGPLCAGLGSSKSCGALAGGVMVLGMVHGRASFDEGLAGLRKGVALSQALVRRFEQEFGSTSCYEISGIDWTDRESIKRSLSSQALEKCVQLVGKTAAMVADLLVDEDKERKER